VGLRDSASHWCIAAHFSPDAVDLTARPSWRHTFWQNHSLPKTAKHLMAGGLPIYREGDHIVNDDRRRQIPFPDTLLP
jgi:hypothetical protein